METSITESTLSLHRCPCLVCQVGMETETIGYHHQINLLLSRLNEPQRRWYVGTLSLTPGAPTDGALSRITGLDEKTIRRGRRELQANLTTVPVTRQRQEGGGRHPVEKKTRP